LAPTAQTSVALVANALARSSPCGAGCTKHHPSGEQTELVGAMVAPHALGSPPPPQVIAPWQALHTSVPPQPSGMVPHDTPADAHVAGTHAHWFDALHANPAAHAPHERVPPQPSGIEPHCAPAVAHVVVVQPQVFAVPPPPQVCGAKHVPQLSVPPQPSDGVPHVAPRAQHEVGVQPQVFG
jgi:hypothetical protein